LSDLVASIKTDPLTPWHKGYDCYLLTYEYARLV
jgi:hypothetical protein